MRINQNYLLRIRRMTMLLGIAGLVATTVALPSTANKNQNMLNPVTIIRGESARLVNVHSRTEVVKQGLPHSKTPVAGINVGDKTLRAAIPRLDFSGKTPSSPATNSEQLAQTLLAKAKSLLGIPYRLGGNNPKIALDCSAFVKLVFQQVGIELPRSTYGQIEKGKSVDYSELQPGDLVFFSCYGSGPTHVGIYLGDGKMINETPPKVEVDTIVTPSGAKTFYGRTYYAARRVLPG